MSEPDNKLAESLIYKLSNENNYKERINESSIIIQLSYVKIVHYYIKHYFETMNNKNKNISTHFRTGYSSNITYQSYDACPTLQSSPPLLHFQNYSNLLLLKQVPCAKGISF